MAGIESTGLKNSSRHRRYEGRDMYNIASDGSTDLERILSDKMLMGVYIYQEFPN
jgi:hypothetical protein